MHQHAHDARLGGIGLQHSLGPAGSLGALDLRRIGGSQIDGSLDTSKPVGLVWPDVSKQVLAIFRARDIERLKVASPPS
jgi:hypothetical protein